MLKSALHLDKAQGAYGRKSLYAIWEEHFQGKKSVRKLVFMSSQLESVPSFVSPLVAFEYMLLLCAP